MLPYYGAHGGSLSLYLTFGLIYLVIYFFIIKPKYKAGKVAIENNPKDIEDIFESPSIFEDETNKPKTLFEFELRLLELIIANKRRLIIIGLLILLLIPIISFISFSTGRNYYRSNPTVVAAADSIVSSVFKPYSSTKFLNDKFCTVKLTGKNIYTVSSYVESQNSFGEVIRNKFKITIQHPEDKWITLEFLLNGKKLK